MKVRVPKRQEHRLGEIRGLLLKASDKIGAIELSQFNFVREYQEAVIRYVEDVLEAVGIGIALKLGVDPSYIHKSMKVPMDILEKAARDGYVRDGLFFKSLFDNLKKKYTVASTFYKKFGFNKGKPLEPVQIKGRIVYNNETKRPLTNSEWEDMVDSVTQYLGVKTGEVEKQMVVRAALLGKLMRKMEREGVKMSEQKTMSWDEVQKKLGHRIPSDEEEAMKTMGLTLQEIKAIEYSKQHAAQYLSISDGGLKSKVVGMVRAQITEGLREGLSAQEMTQRLFWIDPSDMLGRQFKNQTIEAINRDWRRVAITEMSYALNNGYLAANKAEAREGEKLYFIFSGNYNPDEPEHESCNRYLGKIFLYVEEPRSDDDIQDTYADWLVWEGKNNVGRRQVEWWGCIPLHPHCTHWWERFYPDIEEWDPKRMRVIVRKDVMDQYKSMEHEEFLDLIKAKRIHVPATAKHKDYWRFDPRTARPHEMTQKEFVDSNPDFPNKKELSPQLREDRLKLIHEEMVRNAIDKGEDVPEQVRKDYPGLKMAGPPVDEKEQPKYMYNRHGQKIEHQYEIVPQKMWVSHGPIRTHSTTELRYVVHEYWNHGGDKISTARIPCKTMEEAKKVLEARKALPAVDDRKPEGELRQTTGKNGKVFKNGEDTGEIKIFRGTNEFVPKGDFDPGKVKVLEGAWVSFSDDYDYAKTFAGGRKGGKVEAAFVRLKKPFVDIPQKVGTTKKNILQMKMDKGQSPKEIVDELKAEGYDGVVIKSPYSDNLEIGIFYKEQAKLEEVPAQPQESPGLSVRWAISKPRNGWTLERIKKELKGMAGSSETGTKRWNRAASEFSSPEEFENHLFYHGTSGYIDKGLRPSVALGKEYKFRSGGYGEDYYVISLSQSKNTASNFTGDSNSGSVYQVLLKKGAKVIDLPQLQDANELEEMLPKLWTEGVDAVRLGKWNDEHSEKELAVLNPKAIVKGANESFQVYQKKRFENPSPAEVADMWTKAKTEHEKVVSEIMKKSFDDGKPYSHYFSDRTGMKIIDDLMNRPGRRKEFQKKHKWFRIVEMSPDKYIRLCQYCMGYKKPETGIRESKIEKLDKAHKEGSLIDCPSMTFAWKEGKIKFFQQGRNRAAWAKEKGLREIPVIVKYAYGLEDRIYRKFPKLKKMGIDFSEEEMRKSIHEDRHNSHKNVVIDVDGTIFNYGEYKPYIFGTPKAGVREALERIMKRGYTVTIFTARHENERAALEKHLKVYKIPYTSLKMDKPIAKYYIDDRAIEFKDDWQKIGNMVKSQVDYLDLLKADPTRKKIVFRGIPINIEWPRGTVRTFPGSRYKNNMQADYGYIRDTDSPDGEEIDVYVNDPPQENAKVYMLNQLHLHNKREGDFDEHKFMLGFPDRQSARECYSKSMDPRMFGGMTEMDFDSFKNNLVKFYRRKNKMATENLHIDNLGWDDVRARDLKKNLTELVAQIEMVLDLKTPVIIHLYKNIKKGNGERAEFDEGVINIYAETPDWRGDFLHELGHQLIRKNKLDSVTQIKLEKIKEDIEKKKGDNRIFVQPHTYSTITEILATWFKWWILGKVVSPVYSEVLSTNCPEAEAILERILRKNDLKKSMTIAFVKPLGNLIIDTEELIKAFITPPKTPEGRIAWDKVPVGATIWITKEGRHIPITRFEHKKFMVDFQAARNAGYTIQKKGEVQSHLSFTIDEAGKPMKHEIQQDKKPLSPEQEQKKMEHEKSISERRATKQKLRDETNKKKGELINSVTDKTMEQQEMDDVNGMLDDRLKDMKLDDKLKEVYKKTVLEEIRKRKRDEKLRDAMSISSGKNTSKRDAKINLVDPGEVKDEFDLMNKVKNGFDSGEGDSLNFSVGVDKKKQKTIDEEEVKQKAQELKESAAKQEKFNQVVADEKMRKVKDIVKIIPEDLKVTEQDIKSAEGFFAENRPHGTGKSLYTVLADYWNDGGIPQVQYLANKSAVRQLNGLTEKYLGEVMDSTRMVDAIGIEKSTQLIATHLKNELSEDQFKKFQEEVENYYTDDVETVEDNALKNIEALRHESAANKVRMEKGEVWDKEVEKAITTNLIEQRNTIGAAFGMLHSTAELINAMKRAKRGDVIDVDMGPDKKQAYHEYVRFTMSKDRANTKLVEEKGKNIMRIYPASMKEFYLPETKIEKDEIARLNKIKDQKLPVRDDGHGNLFTAIKVPHVKPDFHFYPSQAKDMNFLEASGGRGVVARATGGGKTMTSVGFFAKQLEKNPKYSMLAVVKNGQTEQWGHEIAGKTNLPYVIVREKSAKGEPKISWEQKAKQIRSLQQDGKIVIISHSDLAHLNEMFRNRKFNNMTIDEPQELFFNRVGDMKSRGKDIIRNIKTEHRVALTATPVQTNPADIYNILHWIDPQRVHKRANFRRDFGAPERYSLDGKEKMSTFSFSDMNLGKNNLVKDYFRDTIDRYVTNDKKIVRPYKIIPEKIDLKTTPAMSGVMKTALRKMVAGEKPFVADTKPWYKEAYPASWETRRTQMYREWVSSEMVKIANRFPEGPKERSVSKNILKHRNVKQVVYVDDERQQSHIMDALKRHGYPKEQLYTLLTKDKAVQRDTWYDSKKPGILFLSKSDVAGHNLQAASYLHKAGTLMEGIDEIQLNGRLPRGVRDTNVHFVDYSYNDSLYERNIRNKVANYIKTLSTVDTSQEENL